MTPWSAETCLSVACVVSCFAANGRHVGVHHFYDCDRDYALDSIGDDHLKRANARDSVLQKSVNLENL